MLIAQRYALCDTHEELLVRASQQTRQAVSPLHGQDSVCLGDARDHGRDTDACVWVAAVLMSSGVITQQVRLRSDMKCPPMSNNIHGLCSGGHERRVSD